MSQSNDILVDRMPPLPSRYGLTPGAPAPGHGAIVLPKPTMGHYILVIACSNCELMWADEEDPMSSHSVQGALHVGALVSVRWPRCHNHAWYDYDKVPGFAEREGYRLVSAEEERLHRAEEERKRTPPRKVEDDEFFCSGCRTIHKMSSAVKDKLKAGKWLRIDCSCGNKVHLP